MKIRVHVHANFCAHLSHFKTYKTVFCVYLCVCKQAYFMIFFGINQIAIFGSDSLSSGALHKSFFSQLHMEWFYVQPTELKYIKSKSTFYFFTSFSIYVHIYLTFQISSHQISLKQKKMLNWWKVSLSLSLSRFSSHFCTRIHHRSIQSYQSSVQNRKYESKNFDSAMNS